MKAEDILDESIFSINEAIKEIRAAQKDDVLTRNYHKLIMIETLLTVAMNDMKEVLESEQTDNAEPEPETLDIVDFARRICFSAGREMVR